MKNDAHQSDISTKVFGNYTENYLHQLGQGLLSIVVEDGVACLFLSSDENRYLKDHIVGFLSAISDVEVACVLVEHE